MNSTGVSITEDSDGLKVENMIFAYDEEERQRNEISDSNAEKVFAPEFIPYYISIQKNYDLTQAETLLYGFIRFYMSNGTGRFYFTDGQLANVLDCNEQTIMRSIKTLKEKDIIKVGHKLKAGGGKIRFITNIRIPGNVTFQRLQNVTFTRLQNVTNNNNKINNNKINNIITPVKTGEYEIFIETFNRITNRKFTVRDRKARTQFLMRLKEGWKIEEIENAIRNCMNDTFHKENNYKYLTPEFITRSDKLEKYAALSTSANNTGFRSAEEMRKALNS